MVDYFNDDSEAIFKLIEMICSGAGGVPVSVCGELAGRVEATQRLLDCGVRKLSVSTSLVPFVKQAVRKASL